MTKNWTKSRTVWVESLQALIGLFTGIVLLLQQGLTPEAMAALGVGLKGIYGIWLRFDTKDAIE